MTRNAWDDFAHLGFAPSEVFMALRTWAGGGGQGVRTRRWAIGRNPRVVVGYSGKCNPIIEDLPRAKVAEAVDHCRNALTPIHKRDATLVEASAPLSGEMHVAGMSVTVAYEPPENAGWAGTLVPPRLATVSFEYCGATDRFVDEARRQVAQVRASGLAALLLWPPVKAAAPPRGREAVWVRQPLDPTAVEYSWVAMPVDPVPADPRASTIDQIPYAVFRTGPLPVEAIVSTAEASTLARKADALTGTTREKFGRALANYFTAVSASSKQERILAGIVAVESLVMSEPTKCDACKQPKYAVRQKFLELVSRYDDATVLTKKHYGELYKLRSSLVHGSFAYEVDQPMFSLGDTSFFDAITAERMARLVLLGWLHEQA